MTARHVLSSHHPVSPPRPCCNSPQAADLADLSDIIFPRPFVKLNHWLKSPSTMTCCPCHKSESLDQAPDKVPPRLRVHQLSRESAISPMIFKWRPWLSGSESMCENQYGMSVSSSITCVWSMDRTLEVGVCISLCTDCKLLKCNCGNTTLSSTIGP